MIAVQRAAALWAVDRSARSARRTLSSLTKRPNPNQPGASPSNRNAERCAYRQDPQHQRAHPIARLGRVRTVIRKRRILAQRIEAPARLQNCAKNTKGPSELTGVRSSKLARYRPPGVSSTNTSSLQASAFVASCGARGVEEQAVAGARSRDSARMTERRRRDRRLGPGLCVSPEVAGLRFWKRIGGLRRRTFAP